MKPIKQAVIATLGLTTLAHGAGYQLQERSTRGLGRAFSGEAAIADDASVMASNPAGMLLVPGDTAISVGLSGIFPDVDVQGVFTPTGAPGGIPTTASDVADHAVVPYLYLTHKVNDKVSVGFGSYTTYGLATNYPLTFAARSLADKSELKTVNLNPSIAYRINSQWSIGVGFDALYADGKLTSTFPNSLPILDLAGDDWGFGYNIGVMFELSDSTRFGLHYRSEVDLTLEGRVVSSATPIWNGPGIVDVTLPDSLEFSVYHEINDRWAIHGDIVWTGWSDFQQLQPIVFGAPVQPPATIENWSDVYRFSIGTTWKTTDRLTLRAGVAYDESPVDQQFMTLRIPDSDRLWLSVGMSYQINPCWAIDLAYTHLFTDEVRINETTIAGNFTGIADGSTNLVALGLSGHF